MWSGWIRIFQELKVFYAVPAGRSTERPPSQWKDQVGQDLAVLAIYVYDSKEKEEEVTLSVSAMSLFL